MISENIVHQVREKVADRLGIDAVAPDRISVATPFMHLDGDHCGFVFVKDQTGNWVITDEGDILTHAGYSGADLLSKGRINRFRKTAEFFGIEEKKGTLSYPVSNEDFGEAFFTFSQACIEISRLVLLKSESQPKKNVFRLRLANIVDEVAPKLRWDRNWHDERTDPQGIYPVDFRSGDGKRNLFVFGVANEKDCLRAAVTTYHYKQKKLPFDSIAIVDEAKEVSGTSNILLEESGTIPFSSGAMDEIQEFIRQKTA
jgi:hypothetical protein